MQFQPADEHRHTTDDHPISLAHHSSPSPKPASCHDSFDDVFGAPAELANPTHASHPSDIHRLQTAHTTTGYREGIIAAKESTVQAGFDEGFGWGATLGLMAGQLLGLLEGIAEAVKSQADENAAIVNRSLAQARIDLGAESIFDQAYWDSNGNWSYPIISASRKGGENDGGSGAGDDKGDAVNLLPSHVASSHPLIQKWTLAAGQLAEMWKIDLRLLKDEHSPGLDDAASNQPYSSRSVTAADTTLDW